MHKKQTLTVAELKSLLLARLNAEQRQQAKLQVRLQRELGNEVQEEKPEVVAIMNKLTDLISDVLARRLKHDLRTTPLLSSQDFVQFIPSMVNEIVKARGDELEAEDRKMLEKCIKATLENISEMACTMVPPCTNPYEEYWRWVTTVLDLASERGIPPTELLALERTTDEITRRIVTKEQFVARFNRAMTKFTDIDVLKKMIVQPILDIVATEAGEEERREFEQQLEAELMPQLRETIEKTKVVINAYFGEEVERIYAAT